MNNKIMSLGYNCTAAQILLEMRSNNESIREPGPMDWTLQMQGIHSLRSFFTGDVFQHVVNNDYHTWYNIPDHGYVTDIGLTEDNKSLNRLAHEILTDNNEKCKYIIRLVHFIDQIKRKGRFLLVYPGKLSDEYSELLFNKVGINKDNIFIVAHGTDFSNYDLSIDECKYLNDDYWMDLGIHAEMTRKIGDELANYFKLSDITYSELTNFNNMAYRNKYDGTYNAYYKRMAW